MGYTTEAMEYKEALSYIYSLVDHERPRNEALSAENFDLRRVSNLLSKVGDPHKGPITVHVAGTKGKGSTCSMIASVLTASGCRTGFFSSPHLITFRERIRIGNQLISRGEVTSLVDYLRPVVEDINRKAEWGRITTFELMTCMAFCHFNNKQVDAQVLEVGLGGRLDSTNVVDAEVTVITPISLDHTDILGSNIQAIAGEKAGIIKEANTLVLAPQPKEAYEVIIKVAGEKKARIVDVEKELSWSHGESDLKGQKVSVEGSDCAYDFWLPLLGEFQAENAATAVAALDALKAKKEIKSITAQSMASGMGQVIWPGRMQVLRERPLWVVDGAHNPASALRLRESLTSYFTYDRLLLILAVYTDKDMYGIIEALKPVTSCAILTMTKNARSVDPNTLAEAFSEDNIDVYIVPEVIEAIETARQIASESDLICATGSLSLVGEVIQEFTGEPDDSL